VNRDVVRLGAIAGALILALIIGAQLYQGSVEEERSAELADAARSIPSVFERPHSRSLGPADARVTIVEFLDPECESCRAMYHPVKRLLAQHPEDVRLVIRYMPLHGNSVLAAGALEAAGAQGRYWEMLESLFANQPDWGNHHQPRPELIPGYARELGLDMAAFDRFIETGPYRDFVDADRTDGIALGVRGTPTFFVNERLLVRLGYEPLKAMVEQELAR
jgi:protein-disulfide isomerase